jgi:pimeloyl-ACP methyl ester carboxylesterase
MPFVDLGERKVYIRDVPAENESGKTPFLFVHGLGSSETFYGSQIPTISQQRRCVALDLPGSARSPVPESSQSVESISDDVLALMDKLHLKKVVLVGHSMGGMIVCHIAAENPKRVESLILVGPVHPTEDGAKTFKERIKKIRKGMWISTFLTETDLNRLRKTRQSQPQAPKRHRWPKLLLGN